MKLPNPRFPFSPDDLAFVIAAMIKVFIYLFR